MKFSIPTEEKKKTLQNDNENDELNANEYYTRDYWKVHDHHLGKLSYSLPVHRDESLLLFEDLLRH